MSPRPLTSPRLQPPGPGSIALCMIVRDEESHLPGCLESVREAVDEIIVVDTGSRDQTPALARAAGATVVSHPWSDDFAAARNAALPHARSPWLLALDADERLAPGGASALRKVVSEADFLLGLLPLHNASRAEASPEDVISGLARLGGPVLVPRLLHRTPDLAWRGVVHEDVTEWLLRNGGQARSVPVPIVHLGWAHGQARSASRNARNLRLLRARLAAEPDWIVGYPHLAMELLNTQDPKGARAALDAGWEALTRFMATGRPRPTMVSLAHNRAQFQMLSGDLQGAQLTLSQSREWGETHPNLDWVQARLWIAQASLARDPDTASLRRALALLDRCFREGQLAWSEETIPGLGSWASHLLAGQACLMLGSPKDALSHFDAALARPESREDALLGRVEALLDLGHPLEALREVEPLLQEGGLDAWALAACAAGAAGAGSQVPALIRGALARRDRPVRMARRVYRLQALAASQAHPRSTP